MGFSDARLAALAGSSEAEVSAQRTTLGVRPVFKRIDTCAAEFAAPTAYMYSTYESALALTAAAGQPTGPGCEANPATRARSSSSAAGRTASGRASSSTTAAATPASR